MKKRIISLLLALTLACGMAPAALASSGGIAKASTQNVEVDGSAVTFQMYALEEKGGLTNYVKLRDVAHVLNSTPARFSVGYDGVISITTGESYTDNGSEMTTPFSGDRAYRPGPGSVKINGADVTLDAIVLTDDSGGAYTYFKLRDLGAALGFKVDWTSERGVFIETGAAPVQSGAPAKTELTMEDLAGIWRLDDVDDNTIFTGNTVESYTKVKGNIFSATGTTSLKKVSDSLGEHYVIQIIWTAGGTNGTRETYDDKRGLAIDVKDIDLESGTMTRIGFNDTFRRIETSALKSEWDRMSGNGTEMGDKQPDNLPNDFKYPTYAEWPGVPDFGAIYGVSMEESHTTSGMIVCSYDYDEVTKRAIELFGDGDVKPYEEANMLMKLKDDYYRILTECGYEKKLVKNVFGDRILVNMNEAVGYRVDVNTLSYAHEYKDWTFEIYIQPLK